MAALRKPLQGVWNIIRFNWHFYALALAAAIGILLLRMSLNPSLHWYLDASLVALLLPVIISLAVSTYVYDFSTLYEFTWLPATSIPTQRAAVLNINAGFDETSQLLQAQFRPAELIVADFYNPAHHTEVSIKRARRAYPPFSGTLAITTQAIPLPDTAVDEAFAFLAAHEIRDAAERAAFFREIARVTKPAGRIIVTEHLRDTANFLAYTIGFFHFHSRTTWLRTFAAAELIIEQEIKITPFITGFILRKRATPA